MISLMQINWVYHHQAVMQSAHDNHELGFRIFALSHVVLSMDNLFHVAVI